MFIKKFDMLSPPITLYFRRNELHSSIYSGILSIIAYIFIIIASGYYFLGYIEKTNPTAYFFVRYIEDAGTFPLNSTSMFSFGQLFDTKTNEPTPFDFQAFRIIGFDNLEIAQYEENPDQLENTNHWLYGPCNNDTDTKGIGYLINHKYFTESACIRKYYSAAERRYYDTDQKNFRWPIIVKGCSNPERTYYGIILEQCKEDVSWKRSGYKKCKSKEEIKKIIQNHSFTLQMIDHYADVLNYDKPFTKYVYALTNGLKNSNIAVNHLNFNPGIMITHNGIFFDNIVEEPAFFYTQNEKQSIESQKGIILCFYFWLQNTFQYYERNYERFQDILGDIGGISSIILIIAQTLNSLVSGYVILLDTADLIFSIESNNYYNEISNGLEIFKKTPKIMLPPKRQHNNNNKKYYNENFKNENFNSEKVNNEKLIKDGLDICQSNYYIQDEEKVYNLKNLFLKRKNILINNTEATGQITNLKIKDRRSRRSYYNGKGSSNSYFSYIRNSNNQNSMNRLTAEKKDGYINKPAKKNRFSWFSFIWFKICCEKNNPKLSHYDKFREDMISEENIIQNHLDIYKLLKYCNLEKNQNNQNT